MTKRNSLKILYLLGFLFAVSLAFTTYINSSFLGNYLSDSQIGIAYAVGYGVGLLGLLCMPAVLRKFGNRDTMLGLLVLQVLALGLLAMGDGLSVTLGAFTAYMALNILIIFSLDIFVESFSADSETGKIRGIFLTSINLAWLISPVMSGYVAEQAHNFEMVYLIALALVCIVFLIFLFTFRRYVGERQGKIAGLWTRAKQVFRNKSLWGIFRISTLLQLFYAVMVIYTPIYLHDYIGFDWAELGLIFTIMLAPFVLLEYPLGRMADKKWGETEVMSAGIFIMGISALGMLLPLNQSLIAWAILLFISRVGASMLEITSESYFFKQIDAGDTGIISFQRNATPIAYIIAPLLASLFLLRFELKYMFLVLAIVIFAGLFISLKLKDTR